LENLLACANELLNAWRETRSDAQTHNAQSTSTDAEAYVG